MAYEFRFPDVGEGITEGELLSWKVRVGDVIREDETLAEVETDKAVVEIPSPKAGKIVKLHVQEGEIIKVGAVLVSIEEAAAAGAAAAPPPAASTAAPTAGEEATAAAPAPLEAPAAAPGQSAAPAAAEAPTAKPPVPTGPGVPPPPVAQVMEAEEFYTGSVVGRLEEAPDEEGAAAAQRAAAAGRVGARSAVKVLAMPSVRSLADELGIDLGRVRGTGPGGRILRQDVEDYAAALAYGRDRVEVPSVAVEEIETASACLGGGLEQDQYGVVERVVFRGVRRTMAKRMQESLSKQAQVTETEEADVTGLKRIREKQRALATERGIHLTYLAFVVKASIMALERFPRLNAVLDESCEEVLIKRYYNIGLAVDTSAGLVVPNIKAADTKSIFELAKEINELVARAQDRKLDVADLHGGTFTVSNYGAIGGIHATPVTNYPEVAVLGMGRVRERPVAHRGQVVIRSLLPLSLTFDHQLIDGAEAARFLNLVVNYLEEPDLMLLEGA